MISIKKVVLDDALAGIISLIKTNKDELIEKGTIKIILPKGSKINLFIEEDKQKKTCFVIRKGEDDISENFKYILNCCLIHEIPHEIISKLLFVKEEVNNNNSENSISLGDMIDMIDGEIQKTPIVDFNSIIGGVDGFKKPAIDFNEIVGGD